jgi:hypothetical protein
MLRSFYSENSIEKGPLTGEKERIRVSKYSGVVSLTARDFEGDLTMVELPIEVAVELGKYLVSLGEDE